MRHLCLFVLMVLALRLRNGQTLLLPRPRASPHRISHHRRFLQHQSLQNSIHNHRSYSREGASSRTQLSAVPMSEELSNLVAAVDPTLQVPLATALVSYAHYAAISFVGSILIYQRSKLQGPVVSEKDEQDLGKSDLVLLVSAVSLFISGYYRTMGFGKGWDFYSHDLLFWLKLGAASTVSGMSLFSTLTRLRRNIPRANGEEIPPMSDELMKKCQLITSVEILALVSIPLISTLMRTGEYLYEPSFEWRVGAVFVVAAFMGSSLYFGKEAFAWREPWESFRAQRMNDDGAATFYEAPTISPPATTPRGQSQSALPPPIAPIPRPLPTPSRVVNTPLPSPRATSPTRAKTGGFWSNRASKAPSLTDQSSKVSESAPWGASNARASPQSAPMPWGERASSSAKSPVSPWNQVSKDLLAGAQGSSSAPTPPPVPLSRPQVGGSVGPAPRTTPLPVADAPVAPQPPRESPSTRAMRNSRDGSFIPKDEVIPLANVKDAVPKTSTQSDSKVATSSVPTKGKYGPSTSVRTQMRLNRDASTGQLAENPPVSPPATDAASTPRPSLRTPMPTPPREIPAPDLAEASSSMSVVPTDGNTGPAWPPVPDTIEQQRQQQFSPPSPQSLSPPPTSPTNAWPARRSVMQIDPVIETPVNGPPPPPRMFAKTRAEPPQVRATATPVDTWPERRQDYGTGERGGGTSSPMAPPRMFQKTRAKPLEWRDPPAPPRSAVEERAPPSSAPTESRNPVEFAEGDRVSTPYGEGIIQEVRKDVGMLVVEVGEGRTTAFLGDEAVEKL